MSLSHTKRVALALIIANIIWGAAPPIFKWSLQSIPLYTLGFIRFIIPALILFAITDKRDLRVQRNDWSKMFYMGYTIIGINVLFLFLGVQRTLSVNATVIGSAGPIFLMLGSLFFLREKIRHRIFIGNLIGFVGVFLIIFQPLLHDQKPDFFLGNIFLLISTLGTVWGTLLGKEIIKRYKPVTLAFWAFVAGAYAFLPFFILEVLRIGFLPHLTIQGLIGILFGTFLSSLTAYWLFFWSLKYFPASQTAVFTYIDPIATIAVALPLLHETLSPPFFIGGFLVFFGIYIAERRIHYHPLHLFWNRE